MCHKGNMSYNTFYGLSDDVELSLTDETILSQCNKDKRLVLLMLGKLLKISLLNIRTSILILNLVDRLGIVLKTNCIAYSKVPIVLFSLHPK